MRRFEENGQIYYRFEDHEINEKREFEKVVGSSTDEIAYEGLMKALLSAVSERVLNRAEAWESVKNSMEPQDASADFIYDRITGRFNKQTQSEK